jgi:hypothetical protein
MFHIQGDHQQHGLQQSNTSHGKKNDKTSLLSKVCTLKSEFM